jgi:hypothetical protein
LFLVLAVVEGGLMQEPCQKFVNASSPERTLNRDRELQIFQPLGAG